MRDTYQLLNLMKMTIFWALIAMAFVLWLFVCFFVIRVRSDLSYGCLLRYWAGRVCHPGYAERPVLVKNCMPGSWAR